jgi:hypothetical protein
MRHRVGILKGLRGGIAQPRVKPTPIVERFNVEEKIGGCLLV